MRVLLGPLNLGEMSNFVRRGFCDHDVRTFSTRDADARYAHPRATFQDVLAQLPPGWHPDLVVFLYPEFQCLLPGIEECPWPTVLMVSDWHASYDSVERICAMFDVVVTDRAGCELLGHQEEVPVLYRPLYGYDPEIHRRLPGVEPVYDLSIVADLDPKLNPERTRFLVKLAQLGDRWRIQYFTAQVRDAYVQRVNQTRITFNHTVRGEMNMRCYEAPACGSLLFCERSNREIGAFLEDRAECVLYGDDDVVQLVEHYLQDEARRRQVAEAGHLRIQPHTYRNHMNALVSDLCSLVPGPRAFHSRPPAARHLAFARQAYSTWDPDVSCRAVAEAEQALRFSPHDRSTLNTLGCAAARAADEAMDGEVAAAFRGRAADAFSQAGETEVMTLLNHAHFQIALGHPEAARTLLLKAVEEGRPFVNEVFYPRRINRFLLEWERTRSDRRRLAQWMAHDLLADLEPERRESHLRAAVAKRPDIGTSWHRLAEALGESSDEHAALLQRAIACDPVSLPARHALIRALWTRNRTQALDLARETARMVSAFPYGPGECERVAATVQSLRQTVQ